MPFSQKFDVLGCDRNWSTKQKSGKSESSFIGNICKSAAKDDKSLVFLTYLPKCVFDYFHFSCRFTKCHRNPPHAFLNIPGKMFIKCLMLLYINLLILTYLNVSVRPGQVRLGRQRRSSSSLLLLTSEWENSKIMCHVIQWYPETKEENGNRWRWRPDTSPPQYLRIKKK